MSSEHLEERTARTGLSPSARLAGIALLAACGLGGLLFELGAKSFGSHEVYVAVPAREMLNTGDWIVPRFGGLPRLEKPPLAYWIAAAMGQVCGTIDEWTTRLPQAISAILLAVLVGCWARGWYGRVAGWGAAAAQLTSVYVVIYGRKAEVDMLLCLLSTAALFLIARQERDESWPRSFWRWSGVYALLALAWMAKFQYGPTMVLVPAVLYLLVERRFRALGHLANPVGLAVFLAAVFIWPLLVLERIPDAISLWRHELIGRAIGELGYLPVWFYLPRIAWMTLPWLPLAVWAMPRSWRCAWGRARHEVGTIPQESPGDAHAGVLRSRERFLWIWMGTVLAIVSAVADKHNNYVLAALPAFSLWAGQGFVPLVNWLQRPMRQRTRLEAWAWTGGVLAAAVFGPRVAITYVPELFPEVWVFAGVIAAGGCGATWLMRSGRKTAAALTLGWSLCVCFVLVNAWELPRWDHRRNAVAFAERVRSDVTADQEVVVYCMGKTPLVYYLGDPVRRIETPEALSSELARRGRMVVVTYDWGWYDLAAAGDAFEVSRSWADAERPVFKDRPLILVELESRDVLPAERMAARDSHSHAPAVR